MGKKMVLGLLIFVNSIFADEVSQSAVATAESRSKACQQALLQAQKEALHQSGINIFTSFEKNEMITNNNEIKRVINNSLQKSYGYISIISKHEKTKYNPNTGYITCEVDGKFKVDTSKLKAQLLALSKKYENEYNSETSRAQALRKRNKLMQKYFILIDKITTTHIFDYNGYYNCGDNLTLNECKIQLKKKIKNFIKKKLADKYNIDSSLIKMDDIELKNDIQETILNYGLVVKYSGKIEAKALSVKNPYIDEINSLNAFLGEKQIENEDEESKTTLFSEKLSKKYNAFTNSLKEEYNVFSNYLSSRQQYLILSSSRDLHSSSYDYDWDKSRGTFISPYIEYLIYWKKKYYFKFGLGKRHYKKSKTNYHGYDSTAYGYDIDDNYNFFTFGISTFLIQSGGGSKLSFDVDYVIPYSVDYTNKRYVYKGQVETLESETKVNNIKAFFKISLNADIVVVDDIILGTGITSDGENVWKNYLWTVRLGMKF